MKTASGFFLCLLVLSLNYNEPLCSQYVLIREELREGKPSKCDCDYHKSVLDLNRDSTFQISQYIGYVDQKLEKIRSGTWKVKNDSILQLLVNREILENGDTLNIKQKLSFSILYKRIKKQHSPEELEWQGAGCN